MHQRQLRCVQARHGTLGLALRPCQPDVAAGLQTLQLPAGGQVLRQPGRPVALRQADIELGGGLAPVVRLHAALQLPTQRLAVRQQQAAVEALAAVTVVEGRADVAEAEHFALARLQGQTAVEQRQLAGRQQQTEDPRRIQRRAGLGGTLQALGPPLPVRLLHQAELQAAQLDAGNAQAARAQAGEDVRHQAQLIQMQRLAVGLQLQVVQPQLRREALPAALQRADVQRLAECGTGLAHQLVAVFGHQRHQRAAEAYVQGRQQQRQRRQAEQRVERPAEQPRRGRDHVRLGPQRSTTSYCSWEYSLSTWKRIGRPMKASRSATLPDSSSSRRPTTLSLASTR